MTRTVTRSMVSTVRTRERDLSEQAYEEDDFECLIQEVTSRALTAREIITSKGEAYVWEARDNNQTVEDHGRPWKMYNDLQWKNWPVSGAGEQCVIGTDVLRSWQHDNGETQSPEERKAQRTRIHECETYGMLR